MPRQQRGNPCAACNGRFRVLEICERCRLDLCFTCIEKHVRAVHRREHNDTAKRTPPAPLEKKTASE